MMLLLLTIAQWHCWRKQIIILCLLSHSWILFFPG